MNKSELVPIDQSMSYSKLKQLPKSKHSASMRSSNRSKSNSPLSDSNKNDSSANLKISEATKIILDNCKGELLIVIFRMRRLRWYEQRLVLNSKILLIEIYLFRCYLLNFIHPTFHKIRKRINYFLIGKNRFWYRVWDNNL